MCLVPHGTAWRLGVSGRNCCLRERTISRPESLPEAGAERPAHLLRLVHPAIHQEAGCAFGDRGADPQSGPAGAGLRQAGVTVMWCYVVTRIRACPLVSLSL